MAGAAARLSPSSPPPLRKTTLATWAAPREELTGLARRLVAEGLACATAGDLLGSRRGVRKAAVPSSCAPVGSGLCAGLRALRPRT
eukprot:scaffold853_cov386-Prasinococcus_capsulatus_cf.AAC.23